MGFLDKLKSFAGNAAGEIQKMKEEKEKAAELQALERYGSIEGANIPQEAEYCLDEKNERIVVRTGIINNKHNYICEYSYDDVAEMKLIECTEAEMPSWKSTHHKLKLILNSGEELNILKIVSVYNEEKRTQYNVEKEKRDTFHIFDIALTFMPKIQDDATKAWVNDLYIADGKKPVFDENGDFLVENMNSNTDSI